MPANGLGTRTMGVPRKMNAGIGAFTMVELLVVVSVVAATAALLQPALSSAKKEARKAVSITNLRQCGTAIELYLGGDDDGALPSMSEAGAVLGTSPTCDPSDYWREICAQAFGQPLIGSYAYIRGTPLFETDAGGRLLQAASDPIVMISIFYASYAVPIFHGDSAPPGLCLTYGQGVCPYPAGLLGLRMDLSVGRLRVPPGEVMGFSWTNAFLSDYNPRRVSYAGKAE